jgi:hypothetical protein
MRSGLKEQLEFALKRAAQAGPRPWPQLKAELVSVGFHDLTLEENHKEITDIFLVCLTGCGKDNSPYDPGLIGQGRSPPQPHLPSAVDLSIASTTLPDAPRRDPLSVGEPAPIPARPPEDGFIRLTENTREKADVRFCFGSREENLIGAHIIEQYKKQLRPRIIDDMIELRCCLDSHPGRTFVIKFQIEESEKFDVLLGRYWKGDKPKEAQSEKSNMARVTEQNRGKGGKLRRLSLLHLPGQVTNSKTTDLAFQSMEQLSSTLDITRNSNPFHHSDPPISPEYLARFVKELKVNNRGNSRASPVPIPARRRQGTQPNLGTDLEYGKSRTRRQTRKRTSDSPWNSLPKANSRPKTESFLTDRNVSAKLKVKVRGESDASMESQPSIFDTEDYQGDESEGSDITSSDLATGDQEPSSCALSSSFLAMVDNIFGKVDQTQQPNGYWHGYE